MKLLQKMGTELTHLETEVTTLRLEIQKRIRAGETTGNVATDYALAAGLPRDEKTIADIESFHAKLKAHAGETAVVVLAKRVRGAGEPAESELRLCQLPATPSFRFDDDGHGWTLGERYARMPSATRAEDVREERLCYGSTVGIAYPNDDHRLGFIACHLGNAEVADYFRIGGTFGPLDCQALSDKLGLPLPTAKLPRTTTWKGVG